MVVPGKFKNLTDKIKSSNMALDRRVNELSDRITKVTGSAHVAFDRQHAMLDTVEQQTREIEDFSNQLSNNPPDDEEKPSDRDPRFNSNGVKHP